MHRRKFLYLTGGLAGLAMQPATNVILFREAANKQIQRDVLGMYVHEGWPYNHPYAARTWTVEDWRGMPTVSPSWATTRLSFGRHWRSCQSR